MLRKLILIFIIFSSLGVHGQQFYTDLYGFRLGQYRNTTRNELGKPMRYGKYDDGFSYEAYILKPDSSCYIVFEYSSVDTNLIWSIQVTGSESTVSTGLKNMALGIDSTQVNKLLGSHSSTQDIGKYGTQWNYDNTNLSVEVNPNGKLSSVKILDNSEHLFPSTPDFTKIPTFDSIRTIFNSGDNEQIMRILSGDVEIYYKNTTYNFKKSLQTEDNSDNSRVFYILKTISKDLNKVNPKNPDEYSEAMRFVLNQDAKHVMKIKDATIKEIVLKYYAGKYYVYEIDAEHR